jgi:hypothetical protein
MRTIAIFGLALLPTFAWAATGDPGHKHKTFPAGNRPIGSRLNAISWRSTIYSQLLRMVPC